MDVPHDAVLNHMRDVHLKNMNNYKELIKDVVSDLEKRAIEGESVADLLQDKGIEEDFEIFRSMRLEKHKLLFSCAKDIFGDELDFICEDTYYGELLLSSMPITTNIKESVKAVKEALKLEKRPKKRARLSNPISPEQACENLKKVILDEANRLYP